MTRTLGRTVVAAVAVTTALALPLGAYADGGPSAAPGSSPTATPASATPAATTARSFDRTYYSVPPPLTPATASGSAARRTTPDRSARPKPPPTRGVVTGQVVGPHGAPIRRALVVGLRFSDFGLPADLTEHRRVLARTDGAGRFRLPQLRQGYLVRICSEGRTAGGGHRASGRPSGECDLLATKRFTPAYVGPDGVRASYLQHTRLFTPLPRGRSLGRVLVHPPAVVSGRFKDGAGQAVYLTRRDGSIADQTVSDARGRYRFEVAPGRYFVEADKDPGLRTDDTVPGYRKGVLLRAGRTTHQGFRVRHAGIVRGQVTNNGLPLADQFVTVLDADGDFAAGVVTNDLGRYSITSLRPGSYLVTTSYAYGGFVPASQSVTVGQTTMATADLALAVGNGVSFSTSDPGGTGAVDAELRNPAGRVVKVYEGTPAEELTKQVSFTGLPPDVYQLYVRRAVEVSDTTVQTDFPWTQATVDLRGGSADLGVLALSQPTLTLSGTLPTGAQVKLTAIPEDSWLRAAYVDGDQATPMALTWTEPSRGGAYAIYGLVPGSYTTAVTTARKDHDHRPSTTGADVATTHSTTVVPAASTVQALTAPEGARVRAELVYAGTRRPVIAPFGYQVTDAGDQSWLFPTVSGPQSYGRDARVERLHAGPATGEVLDLESLYADHPDVLIPDSLVSSARTAEWETPYWFTSPTTPLTLTAGRTTDAGRVPLKLHGVVRH